MARDCHLTQLTHRAEYHTPPVPIQQSLPHWPHLHFLSVRSDLVLKSSSTMFYLNSFSADITHSYTRLYCYGLFCVTFTCVHFMMSLPYDKSIWNVFFFWDTLFLPCSCFFWHRNSLLIFSEGHPNAGQLRYKITRPRELWESRGIWHLVQLDLLNNRRSDPQNPNPSVRSVLPNVRSKISTHLLGHRVCLSPLLPGHVYLIPNAGAMGWFPLKTNKKQDKANQGLTV